MERLAASLRAGTAVLRISCSGHHGTSNFSRGRLRCPGEVVVALHGELRAGCREHVFEEALDRRWGMLLALREGLADARFPGGARGLLARVVRGAAPLRVPLQAPEGIEALPVLGLFVGAVRAGVVCRRVRADAVRHRLDQMRRTPFEIAPLPGTGRSIPRREFLRRIALAGGAVAATALPGRWVMAADPATVFPDGIKSGDPQHNGGVLWTRVAPPEGGGEVEVLWSVADDAGMEQVVRGGVARTDAARGYTVTVPVRRLDSDRWYHYRFETGGTASVTGRLRTAPLPGAQSDRLRFAFASCQHYEQTCARPSLTKA